MKIVINGQTIAESDQTILIEGNHYFPPESVDHTFLTRSKMKTDCFWKGQASYFNFEKGGQNIENVLWTYENPLPNAKKQTGKDITGWVSGWREAKFLD